MAKNRWALNWDKFISKSTVDDHIGVVEMIATVNSGSTFSSTEQQKGIVLQYNLVLEVLSWVKRKLNASSSWRESL